MIKYVMVSQFGPTPGILARERTNLIKAALTAAAANHHAKYMWRHFKPEAYRRYGYTERTAGYVRKKLRVKGHNRPMVWSGESETLARIRDVRATRNQARLVQHARGLNRRRPTSLVYMNKEITAVAPPEVKEAARVAARTFLAQAAQIKRTTKTSVG